MKNKINQKINPEMNNLSVVSKNITSDAAADTAPKFNTQYAGVNAKYFTNDIETITQDYSFILE